MTLDLHKLAQPDRTLNLMTGEVEFHDEEDIARRNLSGKKAREISFDVSRTKETCVGPDREVCDFLQMDGASTFTLNKSTHLLILTRTQWHEFITDEGEWQTLVQKELERVLQTPTEQHSWVATVRYCRRKITPMYRS